MPKTGCLRFLAAVPLGAACAGAWAAQNTQGAQPAGKMFCWKNKAGKTECGDKVPVENQDSAIKEINKQGVVVKSTEAVTPEERRAQEDALAKKRLDDQKAQEQR